jgi:DNA-binding LytR/AlgR family response regulator
MIRCVVIDDEPLAVNLLKEYISKVSFLQLVASFTDAVEAREFLEKEKPDLIFLDIQMPDINGIQFYHSMPEKPMVIFTTAFSEYAVEGFNVNAVDYLLKPFEYDRFVKAVYKAKEYYEFTINQEMRLTSVFVKADYQLVKVNLKEVLFIEGLDDYIRIHMADNKNILTLMSLKAIAEKLPLHEFIRVHRSYIVPLGRIEKVSSKKIEISGREIPVGISYAEAFFQAINKKIMHP